MIIVFFYFYVVFLGREKCGVTRQLFHFSFFFSSEILQSAFLSFFPSLPSSPSHHSHFANPLVISFPSLSLSPPPAHEKTKRGSLLLPYAIDRYREGGCVGFFFPPLPPTLHSSSLPSYFPWKHGVPLSVCLPLSLSLCVNIYIFIFIFI